MRKFGFLIFLLIIVFSIKQVSAQGGKAYIFPLKLPPLLSATFGELRPGHFHAGIDIKTNGQTGYRIYAVADGYVFRVKIQRGGYGKALYIKHKDGNISVYGHLSRFAGDLEQYVKHQQYKKRSFYLDLFFSPGLFPVKQGDVVAYSGNTGGSMGPHLHFEIRRDEAHPVNPLSVGYHVADTVKPVVTGLFAYALNDTSHVNQSSKRIQLNFKEISPGKYVAEALEAYGMIGLGVSAYDRQSRTWNKNGLYAVDLSVNGLIVYETKMDEINYATTRNINLLIDYPYYFHHRKYIQKLWRHPEAKLPVFTKLIDKGKIRVENGKSYKILIRMSDYEGNMSVVELSIIGKKMPILEKAEKFQSAYYIMKNRPYRIHGEKTDMDFPAETFYDNRYLAFEEFPGGFFIGPEDIPLRKSFTAKFSLQEVPGHLKPYVYLGRINPRNGRLYFVTAKKRRDSLILHSGTPGRFQIAYDSIPPKIYDLNIRNGKWISHYRYLRFKVSDKQTGIAKVEAFIDGRWILTEYDYKTGKVFYDFDDLVFKGVKHNLLIRVWDQAGNKAEKKLIFYRKFKSRAK